jgi:hypothetical protein
MTLPPEGRQFRRIPIAYEVKVVAENRMITYPMAINLSMGGLLVRGHEPLPVGAACGVAILLGKGEPGRRVVARGTVVRSDAQGMAIAFSRALDPNSEAALRMLIHSLDPGAEEALGARSGMPNRPYASKDAAGTGRLGKHPEPTEPMMQDPETSLAHLMDRVKPGSARHVAPGEARDAWEPPAFEGYEAIREWMKESVMSATMYERYPDGRWTIQLLLKEQNPGTYRYIVL